MVCIAFTLPTLDLPAILLLPFTLPGLPLPLSFDFCCRFTVPDILGLNGIIAAINAAITALGAEANSLIAMAEAEVLAAVEEELDIALMLSLSCPFD